MQTATQWLTKHRYESESLATNQKLIGYRQRDVSSKIRTFSEKTEDIFVML